MEFVMCIWLWGHIQTHLLYSIWTPTTAPEPQVYFQKMELLIRPEWIIANKEPGGGGGVARI
jgi:hypothetical protein